MNRVQYTPAGSITTTHMLLIFDVVYPHLAASNFSNTYKLQKIQPLLINSPGYLLVTTEQKAEIQLIEGMNFSSTTKPLSLEELKALQGCGCGG